MSIMMVPMLLTGRYCTVERIITNSPNGHLITLSDVVRWARATENQKPQYIMTGRNKNSE